MNAPKGRKQGRPAAAKLTSRRHESHLMAQNPLQAIEAILEEGRKASTYKLALLRAINDWIIEHPTRSGAQQIPVSWLAVRFIDYYWPLLVHPKPVRQTVGSPGRSRLRRVFSRFSRDMAPTRRPISAAPTSHVFWVELKQHWQSEGKITPELSRLVADVRRLILDQPMQHLHTVSGARIELFGLQSDGVSDYEEARRQAMGRAQGAFIRNRETLDAIMAEDPTVLTVPAQLYEGLVPLRYCLRAALVGRWAELCEARIPENAGVGPILPRLAEPTIERDAVTTGYYHKLYRDMGATTCWITGETLAPRWAVDHVIPWSRFPVQAFWNLAPANPAPNSQKSNHIVRLEGDLLARYENHIGDCLDHDGALVRRDLIRLYGPDLETAAVKPAQIVSHSRAILQDLLENMGLPEWVPI